MHRHDFWNQKSQIQRPQPHILIQLCPELTVRNNSIRLNWKQRLHSSSSKRHFLLSGKETWSLKHGTVSATCCTYDHRQTTVQTATWTMGVPPGLSCQLLWGQGKTHNTCQLWGIKISIIIIIRNDQLLTLYLLYRNHEVGVNPPTSPNRWGGGLSS